MAPPLTLLSCPTRSSAEPSPSTPRRALDPSQVRRHPCTLSGCGWSLGLALTLTFHPLWAQNATSPTPRAVTADAARYQDHPALTSLAQTLAEANGLDPTWVRSELARARHLPSVARLVLPAPVGTPKNWAVYRARFVEPRRLRAGLAFWQRHRETLARAEARYGVPAWLIVGVIGVETLYGQHMGGYRVLDALATLALDFPETHPRAAARQAFFQAELGAFLALCQTEGLDPQAVRGSYAGAMGLPQFMPSSWQRYAVDFDGDGHIDLMGNAADAIGSVANYFQAFGWQPGMPTHFPVQPDPNRADMPTLLAPDIRPSFDSQRLQALGLTLDEDARKHPGPMALVELENGNGPRTHVLGTQNFYAVTRYNWSSYYALAVIELGQTLAKRMTDAP